MHVAFLVPALVVGASSGGAKSISYAEAVARAVDDPVVIAAKDTSRALKVAADDTPLLDAQPVISAAVGARFTPTTERGLEFQVSATQSISLANPRERTIAALRASGTAKNYDAEAEVYRRRLAIAKAWLLLRTAEEMAEISERTVEQETEYLSLVGQLVNAGESSTADLALAKSWLLQAQLLARNHRGLVVERAGEFATLLHVTEIDISTTGSWPEPELPEVDVWSQSALRYEPPQRKAIASRLHAVRAEGEATTASLSSRVNVGLQAQKDALGAGIGQVVLGLTIPVFDLAAPNRARTAAAAAELQAQADRLIQSHAARVAGLEHELEHTREVYELLHDQVVPNAEHAVRLRQFEVESGEATHIALLEAKRLLHRSKLDLVTARFDRTWIRIQAAALLGTKVKP